MTERGETGGGIMKCVRARTDGNQSSCLIG